MELENWVGSLLHAVAVVLAAAHGWFTVGPFRHRYVAHYIPSGQPREPYRSHSLPSRISNARQQPEWNGEDTAAAYRAAVRAAARRRANQAQPIIGSSSARRRRAAGRSGNR